MLGLENHPASETRVYCKYTRAEIDAHVAQIKDIGPEER
tara:strand:+ start:765 stop:881 length:117 start_codon:yes stop_codon:yes gene_type:complete